MGSKNEWSSAESIKMRDNAKDLLSIALQELKEVTKPEKGDPRFFFPKGIELIDIKVSLSANCYIELIVSGDAKAKDSLASEDNVIKQTYESA